MDNPNTGEPFPKTANTSGGEKQKRLEKLAHYRSEIKRSQEYMSQKGIHQRWKANRELYSENSTSNQDGEDAIDVPIGFANINVLRSSLTVQGPRFACSPRNKLSGKAAALSEVLLNHSWYHLGHQDEVRDTVDDILIYGDGFLKAGYSMKAIGNPKDAPSVFAAPRSAFDSGPYAEAGFDTAFDELIDKINTVHTSQHMMGGEVNRKAIAEQYRSTGEVVLQEDAELERVDPFDILVDPSGTNMKTIQWIAQRVPWRRDVAEKNTAWPAEVRKDLKAGQKSLADDTVSTQLPTGRDRDQAGRSKGIEWVILWEFYDLHTGEWCLFSEDATNDFLIKPEPMPHHCGHPFIHQGDYHVPGSFWHLGELDRIRPLQLELNKTRSQLVNDRKHFRRKWVMDEAYLDTEGPQSLRQVLQTDADMQVAVVKLKQGKNLSDAVVAVPTPTLDANLYNVGATMIQDMNDVTGITEYQRGGGPIGSSTATEASIINDGAMARMKEKQGKIEALMAQSARKLISLQQQYLSSKKALRLHVGDPLTSRFLERLQGMGISYEDLVEEFGGGELTEMYFGYDKDRIQGEFDVIVEPGSSAAFNESQRQRKANELMAALGPFIQTGLIDVEALLRYFLQYGFGIPNATDFLKTQQPAAPQPTQGGAPYDPYGQLPGQSSVAGSGGLAAGGGIPDSAIGPPQQPGALAGFT